MSRLLDPMHRRHIEELGIGAGCARARGRLRQRLDLRLARRARRPDRAGGRGRSRPVADRRDPPPNLDCARPTSAPARSSPAASTSSPRGPSCTTSPTPTPPSATSSPASPRAAAILLIEPDFLPVSVAEPPEVHGLLGRLARLVARAGHRLLYRPHPGPPARRPGPRAGRGHGGDRRLQRRLALGRLLDRHGHRAPPPPRGLGQARRPARRPLPRPVRRPVLVDADHRLHRRPRAGVRG